ncbi:MAG: hypothetical protein WA908_08585 [Pontixanthobacter sp.]
MAKDGEVPAGERELADMLDGRIAGEPVRCLQRHERDRMITIQDTALVFRNGDTLYVNRTDAARFIDEFDLPVLRTFGGRLCRLDQIEFVARPAGIGGPTVTLTDFIPYIKSGGDVGSKANTVSGDAL